MPVINPSPLHNHPVLDEALAGMTTRELARDLATAISRELQGSNFKLSNGVRFVELYRTGKFTFRVILGKGKARKALSVQVVPW